MNKQPVNRLGDSPVLKVTNMFFIFESRSRGVFQSLIDKHFPVPVPDGWDFMKSCFDNDIDNEKPSTTTPGTSQKKRKGLYCLNPATHQATSLHRIVSLGYRIDLETYAQRCSTSHISTIASDSLFSLIPYPKSIRVPQDL